MKFIITTSAIFILGIYTIYWFIKFIKNKVNNKNTSSAPFFILITLICGLIIYDIILAFGFMATNREKITNYGQEVISNSVDFASTAILEGFGETSDYFDNKWKSEYLEELNKVDVSIVENKTSKYSDLRELIILDLEFTNNSDKELSLYTISNNSYILITNDGTNFYPLEFDYEHAPNNITKGTSRLIMKGLVPINFVSSSLKIGNRLIKI